MIGEYPDMPGEEEIAKIITRELEDVADKIEKDSMGNLIATKKGEKKAPTVMLAAHMDEIGLMVRYIDDKGFIRLSWKYLPSRNSPGG